MSISRRHFMSTIALGAPMVPRLSATLAGIGVMAAHAQNSEYRALVCLNMAGGNDSHNWIVPLDPSSYADYARSRSNLALPMSSLQGLSTNSRQQAGRSFGMPGDLAPMRSLYQSGRLAVVANLGTLEHPLTKADFEGGRNLPPKLFSHNDQSSHWQSMGPEGTRIGWGGRMADALQALNPHPIFTSVSASGAAVLLGGTASSGYMVNVEGPAPVTAIARYGALGSTTLADTLRQTLFQQGANPFQKELAKTYRRSVDAQSVLASAMADIATPSLPSAPLQLSTGAMLQPDQLALLRQLQVVARMIVAGQRLGMRRQVFMVSTGGFDTHGNQLRDHPALMAGVAVGMEWFTTAMNQLGLGPNVTTFTASDFGRTLSSNGSGSDHGWGSHHFVAGGAVRGGSIFGQFPSLALGGPQDVGSGRLLPTTSVSQYAGILARWFGISNADLPNVVPYVDRFALDGLGFV